ncbi:cobalt-precorrin-5B (C(1))-methyltransferase CbiD [uncultured Ilyobacter sp.]|uniref:cobalt-precorrin-5B (C(1))-methyltransferase CbiD n=1 Tax=uncultured Ilyobacter sp. TaxID=544433 RepID=UPI00374A28AA
MENFVHMDKFIYQDGKKLRYGYTTGSCATAAAKGAVEALFTGKFKESVKIDTPFGWELDLQITETELDRDRAVCAIRKDAGDDPDVTHGILIFVSAEKVSNLDIEKEDCFYNEDKTVELTGGVGVGKVTKKGLQVPPGKPAINEGPRSMIFKEVQRVLPEGEKVRLEIFIPEGQEKALMTFNPKLGIMGGISVLGSSGIVKPMSEEAYKSSLTVELGFHKEERKKNTVVFTFGNYGKRFIKENLDIPIEDVFVISNFAGFMIEQAAHRKFERVILLGHIGKMVKLAGGIFHTHSKVSDAKMEIFTTCALLAGEDYETLLKIADSNTTDEAVEYVTNKKTYEIMCERIVEKCSHKAKDIEFASLLFSFEKGELGRSHNFNRVIKELETV